MIGFDFENFDEKEKQIANIILQEIKDTIEGGLTSRNFASSRNTIVFNEAESLDSDYPFIMDFEVIPETIKIVSVKVSFKIKKFRAYSKAGAAAGTPSGGGATSGATGSASGGGSTSGAGGGQTSGAGGDETTDAEGGATRYTVLLEAGKIAHETGYLAGGSSAVVVAQHTHGQIHHHHSVADHQHTTPNHTHPNHTHSTPAHTHPDHTHNAVYGIFEEDTSPTIHFWISEDDGGIWKAKHGGYTEDQTNLDITSYLTLGNGEKMLKFTSDVRCRISARILLKLDIKAR